MGKNLVVRGLNTYWKGGAETAITLSEEGHNIKALVGGEPMIAGDIVFATGRRLMIIEYLQKAGIPVFPRAKNIDDSIMSI